MAFCCKHKYIFGAALFLLSTANSAAQRGRALNERMDTASLKTIEKKNDTMTLGRVWGLSLIAPSFGQFYNKQYWKTPIVLGGIGGFAYAAYNSKENRAWYIAGAGIIYWAGLLDAAACYPYHRAERSPSKAAVYAAMLPGLGQIYNKKYWKLPLVYGGFMGMGYLVQSRNFRLNLFTESYNIRYKMNTIKTNMDKIGEGGDGYADLQLKYAALEMRLDNNLRSLSVDQLKAYKDRYRRDRDYYIILMCLFYGLSIVDAVVDAHFVSYDVSNNLSLHWQPFVERWAGSGMSGGVSFSIRF